MQPVAPSEAPRLPIAPHRRYRAFLVQEEHAALMDWALANEAGFAPSRVRGRVVQTEFRRSMVLRKMGPLRTVLKQRLLEHLPRMVADLGLSRFEPSHVELELVAHNDQDHFALHADTYRGDGRPERGDRMLSGVYYFHREPKAFGGGELRLHRFGAAPGALQDYVEVEPEQNSLVAFPAWAPHEVRPVTCPSRAFADSRFSVNCWIYRPRGLP
jgi:Rps23 Pro-64 3,4-dihydroxylase Tpa1-like proline 4-hydroxylase